MVIKKEFAKLCLIWAAIPTHTMYEQALNPQRAFADGFAIPRNAFSAPYAEPSRRSQAMGRRIKVFFAVSVVCLLISLGYDFSRSAIYMATARVQIIPAGKLAASDSRAGSQSDDGKRAFLVEAQVLSSRPLLQKVVKQMQTRGLWQATRNDPVQAAQDMLTVLPMEGTDIVQLQAQSTGQALVAPLINAVIEVYRDEQTSAGSAASQTQLLEAREEVNVIEAQVAEKRRGLEALRVRSNIVSGERDENQTLSRLKGLSASLSTATEREATATGRVRALEQAITEGKRAPQAKDNPTVAAIESRLSQMKEDWRALERQFTPQYLDMDASSRALKTRIGNLEQQLEGERQKAQHMALADAREELAGIQATAQRLQQQLSGDRQEVQAFSRRFGEFQTLQEELLGLEKMRQGARQKLLALEAGEAARRPRMLVVEAAAAPDSAWRPLYWRDAGIGLLASVVLGFLAVWFVEFFNRAAPQAQGPSAVLVPQAWMAFGQQQGPQLAGASAPESLSANADTPLLESSLPRELASDEVDRLLAAAAPENRPVLACLLCGLTPQEVMALQLQHVDASTESLTVPGESNRTLPLAAVLRAVASQRSAEAANSLLFFRGTDRALDVEDINVVVTSSAYDAQLELPQTITAATLRHTYIAFLVRQGLRFSELGRVVGRLNAETFTTLAALAPGVPRVSIDAVDRMLPELKDQ
jgi:succinoglycan biosynthesis transport protein ExoP